MVALGQVVQFPMMFLSGIFFPLELLPHFLRPVAKPSAAIPGGSLVTRKAPTTVRSERIDL